MKGEYVFMVGVKDRITDSKVLDVKGLSLDEFLVVVDEIKRKYR